KVQEHRSFVIADIPGVIEGASAGAGLGIRFLKHLTRCRVLLHVLDVAPVDGADPVENFMTISRELEQFSPSLLERERWLVLNKVDLLPEDEREQQLQSIVDRLNWSGPVHSVSAISKQGTDTLAAVLMKHLEDMWQAER